jgi:hypothetical protein
MPFVPCQIEFLMGVMHINNVSLEKQISLDLMHFAGLLSHGFQPFHIVFSQIVAVLAIAGKISFLKILGGTFNTTKYNLVHLTTKTAVLFMDFPTTTFRTSTGLPSLK